MPSVNVKWGKEKLTLDADLSEAPITFKGQLFALTGVPPDRQKVLIKGRTLGNDDWNGITLKDGDMIMMMGSADALPVAPVAEQSNTINSSAVLRKDLPLPRGLNNLGNTCYLNSVLQSFKTIPELRTALSELDSTENEGVSGKLSAYLKNLYDTLNKPRVGDSEVDAATPLLMLQAVHMAMPHFAERNAHGQLEQQDANECYTELQRHLLDGLAKRKKSSVDLKRYFNGEFKIVQKCVENEEEEEQVTTETFSQLSCFLSQEVKYIQTGIKEKLSEEIVKNSQKLGRDAKWSKKALISRLPAYISVQMVRFFYKESAKTSAKVLKDVKFPLVLDLCDICTPELQERMRPHRDAVKLEEDAKIERMRKKKIEGKEFEDSLDDGEPLPFSFPDDIGTNNSGFYSLQAVITHKGRSSNSGHYVAWVRIDEDKWVMCDDDEVHPVNSDQVLKLSGGGDWHTAYVLLYGPRIVKKYPALTSDKENTVEHAAKTEMVTTELFTPEDELTWWDNADKERSWWQPVLKRIVNAGPIPRHVAFVMDGNRRFARTNKLGNVIKGHMKGFEQLAKILDWCRDLGVQEVTVYAFSIENFKRSDEEVNGLMKLAEQMFGRLLFEKKKLEEKEISFRFLGNLALLSPKLKKMIALIELETEKYTKGVVNVCMPYTSRDEMTRAFELIRKGREKGLLEEKHITEWLISKCLDSRRSRDPDILVRTSGERRLSDFLLWQCSSSHIYFDDVLWPDFGFWNLCKAVLSYQYYFSSIKNIRENHKSQVVEKNDPSLTSFLQFVDDTHRANLRTYAEYI